MKLLLTAAGFSLFLSSHVLASEPTEAEKRAMAEMIFEQASTAMTSQDYASACPKLEEVVKLQPNGIGARIKLGECYEASGRLASAHASYSQAASMAAIAGQHDRAAAAQERASALEPRLSKLIIKVSPELAGLPGLSIMRGDVAVTPALFNSALAVDGGRYTVVGAADGRKPFTTTLDIDASGATHEVELELPRIDPGPAPSREPRKVDPASQRDPSALPPVRIAGIVIGAVGLATAGAGVAVAVTGIGQSEDAAKVYRDSLDEAARDAARRDHQSADQMITAGWALTGVGAAAAVGGLIMVVVAPSAGATNNKKSARSMWLMPTAAGLIAAGTW